MAKFDERNNHEYAKGISATLSGTTPAKGNIVDLQGWESATFILHTGTVTDAGTTAGFAFEVQESDTTADSAFTAVADADLIGLESELTVTDDDADDDIIGSIGYRGEKRYVRVVATGTTNTDAYVGGVWVLGRGGDEGTATVAADIAAT